MLLLRPAANLIFRLQFMCVRCTCVRGCERRERAWRVRGSRCDSLATPPHAFPYPSPSLPPPLGLCLNICNMLGERTEFEFSGGSMQRVRLCVCVRVYLAPQMRFLCVGWRLAACGCRLMEFRSGIKCDTQKLPIGIHIYSYCQSYAHTQRQLQLQLPTVSGSYSHSGTGHCVGLRLCLCLCPVVWLV